MEDPGQTRRAPPPFTEDTAHRTHPTDSSPHGGITASLPHSAPAAQGRPLSGLAPHLCLPWRLWGQRWVESGGPGSRGKASEDRARSRWLGLVPSAPCHSASAVPASPKVLPCPLPPATPCAHHPRQAGQSGRDEAGTPTQYSRLTAVRTQAVSGPWPMVGLPQ